MTLAAARGEDSREGIEYRHVYENVAYRIVSIGVFGFLLLTASACTLTVQSGPSSPAYMGYAAAPAGGQDPMYVPVATNPPARTPGNPVVVAPRPAPQPSPAAQPAPSVAPRPSAPNPVVIARVPTTAPPSTSNIAPRTPAPAAKPTRRLGRQPVFPSMPATHTQPATPVSATGHLRTNS